MANSGKQEFEELSIGTIEGLQAFLRNAQSQYNAGLSKEADLVARGDHEYGDLLHDSFGQVRNTANALIAGLQAGEDVSHKDAFTLQQQYDDLVRLITKPRPPVKQKFGEPKPVAETKLEPELLTVPPKKSVPTQESVESKPKTGALNVVSDDTEVIDVKDRVTVDEQSKQAQTNPVKKKKRRRRRKKSKPTESVMDSSYRDSIGVVVEKSRKQLHVLEAQYSNPNMMQQMLFEEAKEGIEQLELMAKKGGLSKDKQASIAELASYVKHALTGVVEAVEIEVDSDQESDRVPVVTEQAKETIERKAQTQSPVSFIPTSVTGSKASITKRRVPKRLQTLPKPDDVYERESLTALYLNSPKHMYFIERHYSSAVEFERLLDATITKIESDTIDQIEKWLGDLPASAFSFIKDMTVAELADFARRPYEEVYADLLSENIKYETYAEWRDLVDEMLSLVEGGERMKFGQLFAHWMVELAMQDVWQEE